MLEYLIYWPIVGILLGALATYIDYTRGTDFKVKDLAIGVTVSAVIGPIMAIVILGVQFPDHVIIKGKKQE